MWTNLLALVCLISTFNLTVAGNLFAKLESKLENPKDFDTPVRLPRRFSKDGARANWLRIENQTGFDGRVQRILVDSEESMPGIRAYGLPKKNLKDNGIIEVISKDEIDAGSRSSRLVEAYGMSKDHLENNGQIERIVPPVLNKDEESRNAETRVPRSVEPETKNEIGKKSENDLEDLDAQEAKVFRPLFVYRKQVARKQNRNRASHQFRDIRRGNEISYNDRRPRY